MSMPALDLKELAAGHPPVLLADQHQRLGAEETKPQGHVSTARRAAQQGPAGTEFLMASSCWAPGSQKQPKSETGQKVAKKRRKSSDDEPPLVRSFWPLFLLFLPRSLVRRQA